MDGREMYEPKENRFEQCFYISVIFFFFRFVCVLALVPFHFGNWYITYSYVICPLLLIFYMTYELHVTLLLPFFFVLCFSFVCRRYILPHACALLFVLAKCRLLFEYISYCREMIYDDLMRHRMLSRDSFLFCAVLMAIV